MRLVTSILISRVIAHAACAQVLQGEWVDQSNKQIEKIRKGDLRVIVVDAAGKPLPGVVVHYRQESHAFRWGIKFDPAWRKDGRLALKHDTPVRRCFNAVSLDAITAWPIVEPTPGEWKPDALQQLISELRRQRFSVRWGPVVSSDPGRLPEWVANLAPADIARACETHAARVAREFGDQLDALEVVGEPLALDSLRDRLGPAVYGRLYAAAHAAAPRARLSVFFGDAFSGQRTQNTIAAATDLRDGFVALDELSLGARFTGTVVQAPLARSLAWIEHAGLPVQVTDAEVGGPSPTAAAINLETVLLTMFASPAVRGFWLNGDRAATLADDSAALLDGEGNPTPAGAIFDKLVHGVWHSEGSAKSDALGNARFRGFAGTYSLTATLPDGSAAELTTLIAAGDHEQIALLQPLKR
jgi:hypothetical protein